MMSRRMHNMFQSQLLGRMFLGVIWNVVCYQMDDPLQDAFVGLQAN